MEWEKNCSWVDDRLLNAVLLGWAPLREGIRERTRVEPRESFGMGENEDSRPSKGVLFPYFLPFVPFLYSMDNFAQVVAGFF